MQASAFSGILMLALMSGGVSDTDLVTLVQPTHYFKSRRIEISIERAIDYAGDDPTSAKTQIVQLSALRYLADETDALRKSPKYADHRKVLEQIARGKKAQDPEGFAGEYANRVLAKLDGAKLVSAEPRPFREEALSWFPANVTIAGALDLRRVRQAGGGAGDPLKGLLKLLPERDRDQMYDAIEKSGNIRLERLSFAYTNGAGQGNNGDAKIYMRFTGKGNQEWIADMIKSLDHRGRLQATKMKDAKDTPITLLQAPNDPPVFMLVGNTDLLVVGHERRGKDSDLVDDVLDARAKKKPHAAAGALKARLAKVPDSAVALLVGEVPEEMKRDLGRTFNPLPTNITAFVERAREGMDVQAETSLASQDDADKFVRKVADLRKQGIDELKKVMQQPRRPGEPPIPFQSMINLLETLQVQSKTEKVQMRVVVPDGLIREMTSGWMMFGVAGEKAPLKK